MGPESLTLKRYVEGSQILKRGLGFVCENIKMETVSGPDTAASRQVPLGEVLKSFLKASSDVKSHC
jgi:hypothetical protein